MKTIAQVLKEYQDRRDATEFKRIKVLEDDGTVCEYPDVKGLHETKDKCGQWLEFYYESFTFEKKMHVKLHGHVVKSVV